MDMWLIESFVIRYNDCLSYIFLVWILIFIDHPSIDDSIFQFNTHLHAYINFDLIFICMLIFYFQLILSCRKVTKILHIYDDNGSAKDRRKHTF